MSRHAIFLQTGNLLLMTPGTQVTKTKVAQTNRGHSNTVTCRLKGHLSYEMIQKDGLQNISFCYASTHTRTFQHTYTP